MAGSPRPVGGTGVWMALADLLEPREAPGAAAAQDPVNPNQWYVYAVGGRAGGALTSTEQLNVTIAAGPPEVQTAAAAWVAGAAISDGRSELTAWSITHSEAANVPIGQTYIYAGGGAESTSVDTAIVPEGGALQWLVAQQMSPSRAGYAGVSGAGFIIAFGGQNAGPDDGITKGATSTSAGAAYLENWNSEGSTHLLVPRYLAGGAYESAFVYVIGGETTGGAATATTERTVL
jgi:hypothetical protein